ncbi:DNA topoisomerase 2-binding protein 1 [Thelohanellus kitauei]|uniref:DNA topoisomerase 2-binding protein 1 n=1 Tax=Thelohanellus kitauei TaxID=669202 RepID=A0A0C2MYU0_THEKT|nr:DNA topoisomerase 2-binding protein 1 [Thelohanellus kitauei]
MDKNKIGLFQMRRDAETDQIFKDLIDKLQYYGICYDFYDDPSTFNFQELKTAIIEPFDLELNNLCIDKSTYVYSAKLALHIIENCEPLPVSSHPLYSFRLKNFTVCCTQVNRQDRMKISKIVRYLGGHFSPHLVSSVTHLVAGGVGSQKYMWARNSKISIVKPSWIFDLWNLSLHEPLFGEPLPESEYKVGPFYGLNICVTGFMISEREKIKADIVSNDGTYTPDLALNSCNILVVANLGSKKVSAARRWKIPCVQASWIEKCVKTKVYHDVKDFLCQTPDFSPVMIEQTKFEPSVVTKNDDSNDTVYGVTLGSSLQVFKGFKIYVSDRYEDSKRYGLHAMIQQMGGEIISTPEISTHVVSDWIEPHIDHMGPYIVCKWVSECYKTQMIQPIDGYLTTYVVDKENDENLDNMVPVEFSMADYEPKKPSALENLQRQLLELKSGLSTRKTKQFREDNIENVFEKYKLNPSNAIFMDSIKDINPANVQPSVMSQVIQYEDPVALGNRNELINLMGRSNSFREELKNEPALAVYLNAKQSVVPTMPNSSISESKPSDVYVQLSSFDNSLKVYYSKLVQKLGGHVVEGDLFDRRITHTVVGIMASSEKFLCSLAAGKWILRESFLKASEMLGVFANETSHQWGKEPNPTKFSLSCIRWRDYHVKTGFGAFHGWKVWLVAPEQKLDTYKRILLSGSAIVITDRQVAYNTRDITHVFIDKDHVISETEFEKMTELTSQVFTLEYIFQYLTKTDSTNVSKLLFKNVKRMNVQAKKRTFR